MSRSDGSTADYYELPEGATQLQDLISHRNLNAQLGEIFRACYRFGMADHSDQLRDAKKILFYAKAEVERLEKLLVKAKADLCVEPAASIDDDSPRAQAIGQNGNTGEHYSALDGWRQWSGGKCPVMSGATVEVKFRDAESPAKPMLASCMNWAHSKAKPKRLEIVAYRIASEARPCQ